MRIQELARRNGICASLIYRWRREQPVSAAPARLVPVRIASDSPPCNTPVPSPRGEPQTAGGAGSIEIEFPGGVRVRVGEDVSLAAMRVTDMRRGFDGLAAMVQQQLGQDPFSGALFLFRGRRGHLLKILAWDGQGLVLYAKRLERGKFVWPQAKEGVVSLTPAQLSMLTEGIDWRMPARTWQPEMVG
jgi:transposase